METNADFLSKVSFFSLMKKEDLERIGNQAARQFYNKKELILKEGDIDKRLFVVISGHVEVIKDLNRSTERHIRTLGPYSYFGEMALIDDLVRSASVIAKTNTEVLVLDQWNLRKEIERYPTIAVELLQMLSRRVRAIEKCMINTLGTFLPICANCKKIREEDSTWISIEKYISDRSETEFSHGICPECSQKLYPELYQT